MIRSLVTALVLAAPVALASDVVEKCTSCHGEAGVSDDPDIPMIAGFSEFAFLDLLDSYRNGFRPERELELPDGTTTSMVAISQALTLDEIDEVALYFSEQTWTPQTQDFDAQLAARGGQIHDVKCTKCHTAGGTEPEDDLALLAGQWRDYLTRQFADFDSGARRMADKMKEKYETLKTADKAALLEYYVGGPN